MKLLTKKFAAVCAIVIAGVCSMGSTSTGRADEHMNTEPSIYDFTVDSIDGKPVKLSSFKGKVLLVVNTASLCGNTPQYASLEALYEKYKHQGLRILAFPENDFHQQEPGDNSSIKEFCTSKYHVSFNLFSKIDVIGDNQAPLYKYLTDSSTDPQFAGPIEWNFAKFLISRDGKIVNRFQAGHDPKNTDVVSAIETQLATK
jgi:glutathione peroxidase